MTKKSSLLHKADPSINFRLPIELKVKILKEADFHHQTVSNYIRDHMQSFLSGKLYEEEIAQYENHSFINSTDFLQLVVWMYKKRDENKCTQEDTLKQDIYINTLKSISKDLPKDLVNEFDKVLLDLMKVKNEKARYRNYDFCKLGYLYNDQFSYKKLEDYLLTVENKRITIYV